jgi:hypothetical protein
MSKGVKAILIRNNYFETPGSAPSFSFTRFRPHSPTEPPPPSLVRPHSPTESPPSLN